MSAEQISDRLFTPTVDLPEGVERIPLKEIKSNHVPMLAPLATLKGVDCQRIGLDTQRCLANAEKILKVLPLVRNKVMDVFKPYPPSADDDPDHMIYSGGFFSGHDRRLMNKIRNTESAKLGQLAWPFDDPRLPEMLFRYRARNFSATLSVVESKRWQVERMHRLNQPADNRQLTPETFRLEILAARHARQDDNDAQNILDKLEAWADQLCGKDPLVG
jgi:exodeoxyribonuclease-1